MRKGIKLSLKVKMIALFLVVGIIPLVVVSLISYNQAAKSLREEVYAKNVLYQELIQSQIDEYLEVSKNNAELLAKTRDVYQSVNIFHEVNKNMEAPEWRERFAILDQLAKNVKSDMNFEDMYITDENGIMIFGTNEQLLGQDMSHREYIQDALSGNTEWSEFMYSNLIDKNFTAIGVPIYSEGESGEIIGTISVVVGQDVIDSLIHDELHVLGETADGYLIDAEGTLISNTMQGDYQTDAALNVTLNTEAVEILKPEIRAGNYNFHQFVSYEDYQGIPVIGDVRVIHFGNAPAGIITEITQEEAFASLTTMRNAMLIIVFISIPIIVLIGYVIAQRLAKPILSTQQVVSLVGQNDLRQTVEVKSNDEVGQMANDLNRTIANLSKILLQVRMAADTVSHGAQEIATGNQDLSQRTEEQASSLEEVSATIEEMSASLEGASQNASEADRLSQETLSTVRQGEEVVTDLQYAMTEITNSSKEIGEIIETVNDIAFQTNLLALNAAVEAARAGEQGRGFAVVAAEVRNLAGRSSEAVKEISKLITESINRVERGNELMEKTTGVLEQIVLNTQKTTDVVAEIAASLREQSSASVDIRMAVEQLNEVTQQNAALVEEIASSSENMSSEAIELTNIIGMFKLANDNEQMIQKRIKNSSSKSEDIENISRKKFREKINDKQLEEEFDFHEEDFERF